MTESSDRLPGLHALRVGAALGVFLGHAVFWVMHWDRSVTMIAARFTLGLQLFYVVSAFALMHSTRAYEKTPNWRSQFYLKRFWRIAPLFYVMMLVNGLFSHFYFGRDTSPLEVLLDALFINNFVPGYTSSIVYAGWSVSVEMIFYAVFPLVLVYIRTIRASLIFVVCAMIVGVAARLLLANIPDGLSSYGDWSFFTQLQYFAFGVVAFLVYDKLRHARAKSTLTYHAIFAGTVLALAIVMTLVPAEPPLHWDLTVGGLMFAVLAVWVTVLRIPALNWAPFQFYGERSYSLYLLHIMFIFIMKPVATAAHDLFQPFAGAWSIVPALVVTYIPILLIAPITYALIEKPGMDFGRSIRAKLRSRSMPKEAAASS